MVNGKSAFSIGSGYELPCMHKQLDIDFVMEQKESPTFNPLAFQREYESIWTGSSTDSLVQLDDLNKCRIVGKAEIKAEDRECEYVLSYDVARAEGSANADSALSVIKIKDKGLVVISGCAHAGIINTVEYAKKLAGTDKVYAVLGGFHLTGRIFDPIIQPTIDEMRRIQPIISYPCIVPAGKL
jgi:metal-dependent hydrolase (beta-lactamase superfamily II)